MNLPNLRLIFQYIFVVLLLIIICFKDDTAKTIIHLSSNQDSAAQLTSPSNDTVFWIDTSYIPVISTIDYKWNFNIQFPPYSNDGVILETSTDSTFPFPGSPIIVYNSDFYSAHISFDTLYGHAYDFHNFRDFKIYWRIVKTAKNGYNYFSAFRCYLIHFY